MYERALKEYIKDYLTDYLHCVDNYDRENLISKLLWRFRLEYHLNGYTLLKADKENIKVLLIKGYIETEITIDVNKFYRSLKLEKIL